MDYDLSTHTKVQPDNTGALFFKQNCREFNESLLSCTIVPLAVYSKGVSLLGVNRLTQTPPDLLHPHLESDHSLESAHGL